MTKKIFIIAGEMSGDTHGAGLMRALQEHHAPVQFIGFGGAQMRRLGGQGMEDWVERAGVLGLWEVLKVYGWFKKKMAQARELIAREKPDGVVLIDYPGFNLRLAKALRKDRYTGRIIFYISPQVWAWKRGRIKTMARLLDLMICIFPFEKKLYEKSGLTTVFAGHPMVDRAQSHFQEWKREPCLVGFFPGSRSHEVARLFPVMLQSARLIRERVPEARVAVSAANQTLAGEMREIMDRARMPEARKWIEVSSAHNLMQRAEVGVVASGTATLESACFGLPYVLVYKVNPLTYAVGKAVVRIKHLGIVNILAGEQVVEELVQDKFSRNSVAASVTELLLSKEKRSALTNRLAMVVKTLGDGNAYGRAADAVAGCISSVKS